MNWRYEPMHVKRQRQINELAERTRALLPLLAAGRFEEARATLKRPTDNYLYENFTPYGQQQGDAGSATAGDPSAGLSTFPGQRVVVDPEYQPFTAGRVSGGSFAPGEAPEPRKDKPWWQDVGEDLGRAGMTALSATRDYVGAPAFAAASGLLGAEQKPILDEQGNPTGRYYRDPGLGDWFGGVGETLKGLVTDPADTYGDLRRADREYFANPEHETWENIAGMGVTDPLTFIGPGAARRAIPILGSSRYGRAAANLLEAERPLQVGGVAGAAAGAQGAEALGVDSQWGQLLAALGGGVAGGVGAAKGVSAIRGAGGIKDALGRSLAAEVPTSQVMFGRGAHPEDTKPRMVIPESKKVPDFWMDDVATRASDDGRIVIIEAPGKTTNFRKLMKRNDGRWAWKDSPYTPVLAIYDSLEEAKAAFAADTHGAQVKPIARERLWFHGSRKLDFEAPDPKYGVEGVTQGPGVYMTADPDVALNYGSTDAARGRTFAVEFDGQVADLVNPIGPKDPMFPGGPSWDDVREKVADRMEELYRAGGPGRKAGEPYSQVERRTYLAEMEAAITKLGQRDLLSDTSRNFGKAATRSRAKAAVYDGPGRNGYAYREVLAQLASRPPKNYTTKRFGRPTHEQGLAIVHDVMGDMGIDAVFHHSPGADGEVLIVINGEKARVRADLRGTTAKPGMTLEELKAASEQPSGPTPLSGTGDTRHYVAPASDGFEELFAEIRRQPDGMWRIFTDDLADTAMYDVDFPSAEAARDFLDQELELELELSVRSPDKPSSKFYLQGGEGRAGDVLRQSFGGTPLRATAQGVAGALYGATSGEDDPLAGALKGAASGALRAAVRAPTAVNAARGIDRLPGVPDPEAVAKAREQRLIDAGVDLDEMARVFREAPDGPLAAGGAGAIQGAERPTFIGMQAHEVADVLGFPPEQVKALRELDAKRHSGTLTTAEARTLQQATKRLKEHYREVNGREPVWLLPKADRPEMYEAGFRQGSSGFKPDAANIKKGASNVTGYEARTLRDYVGPANYERMRQLERIASTQDIPEATRQAARAKMHEETGTAPPAAKGRSLGDRLLGALDQETPSAGIVAEAAMPPAEAATAWGKVGQAGIALINLPRALLASGDISFMGRQGIILGIHYPKAFKAAHAAMFRAMRSETVGRAIMDDILTEGPYAAEKQQYLQFTEWGRGATLSTREEGFMSSIASRIPGLSHSERGNVVGLNKLRSDAFDNVRREWDRAGRTADPESLKSLGEWIMASSGRADIAGMTNAGAIVNAFFFSPRFLASRLKLPSMLITDPAVRKQVAIDLIAFAGMGIGALTMMKAAGADVGTDPFATDFGKIRAGKRTWDFWAGYGPIVRGIFQLARAGHTDAGGNWIEQDRLGIIGDFLGGKLSPSGSTFIDLLRGETRYGENFEANPSNISDRVWAHTAPLFVQDLFSAMSGREGPGSLAELGPSKGLSEGLVSAAGGLPGIWGVGTNEYNGPIDDLDNAAEAFSRQHPEKYPDGEVGWWDLEPIDREAVKQAVPDAYGRYIGQSSGERQRSEQIRADIGARQQAIDDQFLAGALTRDQWKKAMDDNKAEQRFRIAEVYGEMPPREEKTPLDKYYGAINRAKNPQTGLVDWKKVDAETVTFTPEEQAYIERNTGLGGTPLQTLYRKASNEYYDISPYRGYTADEARAIDAAWEIARGLAGSGEDWRMARALKTFSAQLDPRVLKGVRARIWSYLGRTTAREKWAKAHPAAGALLLGSGPLALPEIDTLRLELGS